MCMLIRHAGPGKGTAGDYAMFFPAVMSLNRQAIPQGWHHHGTAEENSGPEHLGGPPVKPAHTLTCLVTCGNHKHLH